MAKIYKIQQSVMAADEEYAQQIRKEMSRRGLLVINIIGSPGAGKTTLLEATKDKAPFSFAVIEGDIATSRDAERLSKLGVPSIQINTHGGCHLEANLVKKALEELPLEDIDVIFIENVGNLVCPAEFDIGEDWKVAVSSIPEGADKPLKYPHLFSEAKAVLLTKVDLVPYVPFDMDLYKNDLFHLNPNVECIEIEALTGKGIQEWVSLVEKLLKEKRSECL